MRDSVIENQLHKSLRTAAKGSGAGLSGWRFEYLFPLLRAPSFQWDSFANLAAAIAVGDAPLWVRDVLKLGRATALKKGDAGVRPLVCHEPLRRLLTRALVFDSEIEVQEYLGPYQFAVGVAGGCPAMALSVKKLAHRNKSCVFFKLDLVNAYNTQSREDALSNLADASPELESFLRQFYGGGSQYFFRTGQNEHCIISAVEGIEQGDAAGPALFACGLKTPLDELRAELHRLVSEYENNVRGYEGDSENLENGPNESTSRSGNLHAASVFAYLDDTIMAVPPEIAGAALDAAIEIFGRSGHTVHPGKSACWSLQTQPQELPASCQRIWHEHGLLVGGIPVYDESKEAVLAKEKLNEVLSKVEKESAFLVKLLRDEQLAADARWARVQSCLLILRYSLAAKLIYFAQTIEPSIVAPFAQQFDEIMRNTYLKIIDLESINADQKVQLSLPLRHGGCGLRTHAMSELQRLFVSSSLLVAPAVLDATGTRLAPAADDADENDLFCPVEHSLRSCIENLQLAGISRPDFESPGPIASKAWATGVAEKLYKKTTAELAASFDNLPEVECKHAKARLLSCGGIGAQWLAQAPTCHLTQLPDEDICSAIRLRLGADTFCGEICPHINADGTECGATCDRLGRHLLSCPSGGGYFIGHDNVCATYCQLAAGADGIPGVVAAWKPQVDAWPRATRGAEADAGFFRIPGSRDTYVDAVCSYANPQTYAGCESTAGKVAERKANQKNADHPVFDPQTRRRLHPFDFCALSFERHGFWAKETISFTRKLAHARASGLGLDPSAEICRWYGIISCCIQRANAKVLRGEPVPARHSPPPVRLFSMGRDLPLSR